MKMLIEIDTDEPLWLVALEYLRQQKETGPIVKPTFGPLNDALFAVEHLAGCYGNDPAQAERHRRALEHVRDDLHATCKSGSFQQDLAKIAALVLIGMVDDAADVKVVKAA